MLHRVMTTVETHLAALRRVTSRTPSPSLHPRELAYVQFVQTYASGDLHRATESLVAMLRDFPLGQYLRVIIIIVTGGLNLKAVKGL